MSIRFAVQSLALAAMLALAPPSIANDAGSAQAESSNLIAVDSQTVIEKHGLESQVNALFKAKDYDGLEKLAAKLRTSQKLLSSGYWFLDHFYKSFKIPKDSSDADWQKRLAALQAWVKARPNSLSARLALSDAMVEYGFKGRSAHWANSVTKDQWKIFEQRLAVAHQILTDAEKLKEKNPHWFDSMLWLGLAESWDQNKYDAVFTRSVETFPAYHSVYMQKAYYLTPRWHGKAGTWQKFAMDAANRIGGQEGDLLYAQIIWNQDFQEEPTYQDDFRNGTLSWPRAKRGFQILINRFPNDLGASSDFCKLSVLAEDRPQAKELFNKIGNKMILEIWGSPDGFKHYRDWAFDTPVNIAPLVVPKRT